MGWLDDNRAFAARHEKSYAAAEAIFNVLEKRRPLSGGESEFLALWEWLAPDRDQLEPIWQEPRFYYWSRAAFDLVGAVICSRELAPSTRRYLDARGLQEPAEGLAAHLRDFSAFALGAAWQLELSLRLATPLKVVLPWCMPASPWSVAGDRSVELHGIRDAALVIKTTDTFSSFSLVRAR
ncbi:MAG: hypothetical protein ACR2NU_05705, partial [Aeoliella sp.]